MLGVLWPLLTLSYLVAHKPAAAASSLVSSLAPDSPPCLRKCGEVDIPYPFGIGVECSWQGQDNFTVTCNNSSNPPRPYMGNIEIINISISTNEMRVFSHVAYSCYNSFNTTGSVTETWFNTTGSPFLISPNRNVFTGIGCYTQAILDGMADKDWSYSSGCVTTCTSLETAAQDGDKCSGLGCCQTDIPGNLSFISVSWGADATNPAWDYSPCSIAFVTERNGYNFTRQDLSGGKGNNSFIERVGERGLPVVLDWTIRNNGSCKLGASGKQTAPACLSTHSDCDNTKYGNGYVCNCLKLGIRGQNPYMADDDGGCTNINECSTMSLPCGPYSKCRDTDGDRICKCNFFRKGDGKSEKGCDELILPYYAIIVIAIVVSVIIASFAVIFLERKNRRNLFNKNGGELLEARGITIYSEKDLDNITNRYSKRLGGGHSGEVFEGSIGGTQAQQLVAVKCSGSVRNTAVRRWIKMIQQVMLQEPKQKDDGFITEIIFQFKISHANVVKLIGCCLETDVPRLVYEFVSNGSLEDRLHGGDKRYTLSLLNRLDIAIGSAEALSHIHSQGDHVHGDVKPANILLDDDLVPKVSDFGSSKFLSVERYARAVAVDTSYLDPVYEKTGRFTVKSDVYSFGVVLLELITRKTPKYDGNRYLPLDFDKCFKVEGSGRKMYDVEIFSGDDAQSRRNMECLDRISMLAVRCFKLDLEERPTMADVVEELKQVRKMACRGSSSSETS